MCQACDTHVFKSNLPRLQESGVSYSSYSYTGQNENQLVNFIWMKKKFLSLY